MYLSHLTRHDTLFVSFLFKQEFPGLEEGLMALRGEFALKLKQNCTVQPESQEIAKLRNNVRDLSRKVASLRETGPGQIAAKQAEADEQRLLALQKKVLGSHPATADVDPVVMADGSTSAIVPAESIGTDADKSLSECDGTLGRTEEAVPKLLQKIQDAKEKIEKELLNGQHLYKVLDGDQVGGGKGTEAVDAKRVAKRKVTQGLVDRGNKRR